MKAIVTLHRYYVWANRMRTHFEAVLSAGTLDSKEEMESFLYMSYWYAALFVVIEGWRELKLTDASVDVLLQSANVELLRRYRNGVFHFQKEYADERFLAFMRDGIKSVDWVRLLNSEFGRYFLAVLKKKGAIVSSEEAIRGTGRKRP